MDKSAGAKPKAAKKPEPKAKAGETVLLSSGNPQIAKGDGDGPVQAYIAAMPDWKRAVGEQLDALIVKAVPKVQKAVKWNTPLYGMGDGHWFVSFYCFKKYVQVGFLNGGALTPLPPKTSKQANVRYLEIHEDDAIDEAQFMDWMKQAAKLPGAKM
jgi:hypothetical protein